MGDSRDRPPDDAPLTVRGEGPKSAVLPRVVDEETQTSTDVTAKLLTQARELVIDRAVLTVLSGVGAGRVFLLDRDEVTVGRSRTATISVDDPGVSRVHARVLRVLQLVHLVEDLKSSNGTYVNGEAVAKKKLENGDRIQLGPNLLLRYTLTDQTEIELQRRLFTGSTTDSLTGLVNRAFALRQLESEIAYCLRHRSDVSVVMMDLDHFKEVNDRYGHAAGDNLLKEIGKRLGETCRLEDVVSRYGGEEFLLVLRGTSVIEAVPVAERIRVAIESPLLIEGRPARVTGSFGIAALSEQPDASAADLITLADKRLFAAKRAGRNRVDAQSR